MSWVAVAVAASAVVGGAVSSYNANEAENAQHDAAANANSGINYQYKQTRADLGPWMSSGQGALKQIDYLTGNLTLDDIKRQLAAEGHPNDASLDYDAQRRFAQIQGDPNFGKLLKPFGTQDFQASPAYQFNLEQGQQAINKQAAARGKFYAPATLQDISKFSQGLASNEFQNAYQNYNTNMGNIWNRLYSMSGSGQNAAASLGGFGTTVASQMGQNMIGAGDAAAAARVAQGNTVNNAIGTAYNGYLTQQILASNQKGSAGGGGSTYYPGGDPSVAGGFNGFGD